MRCVHWFVALEGRETYRFLEYFLIQFWSQKHQKHYPKIATEIDAKRFLKIEEMMRKQTCISIVFGITSYEQSKFLKKVHVRESYDFPSSTSRRGFTETKRQKKKERKPIIICIPKIGREKGRHIRRTTFANSIPKSFTKVDVQTMRKSEKWGRRCSRRAPP